MASDIAATYGLLNNQPAAHHMGVSKESAQLHRASVHELCTHALLQPTSRGLNITARSASDEWKNASAARKSSTAACMLQRGEGAAAGRCACL